MDQKIDLAPIVKILIVTAIGLPLVISLFCTLSQCFPATYAIDYLTEEDGTFSVKVAVMINWLLFMLAELPIIIVIGLIKKLVFNTSTKQ
jgi:hypothetical protein